MNKKEEFEKLFNSIELSLEISESNLSLDEIIKETEKRFPAFKFSRTESRYISCKMAIFEKVSL